jgi:hypothetical protein
MLEAHRVIADYWQTSPATVVIASPVPQEQWPTCGSLAPQWSQRGQRFLPEFCRKNFAKIGLCGKKPGYPRFGK